MSKLTLKQMILNEIDNRPRGYAEELAALSGYSSGSALKKVLKDEKKEFEKFSALVKIVHELFKDKIKQTMTDYASTLDVKKQTARYFLEYCQIHTFHEIKEMLIEKMINCGNSQSEEWAKIYQIKSLFMKKEIGLGDAISRFSAINPKQPETEAAIEIYKSYCYLEEQKYNMVYDTLLSIGNSIDEIKEPYIKDLFKGRYQLLMIEHYFRRDELEKARDYCKDLLLNDMEMFRGWAYLHLGNSFIIDDFDKAYEYFNKGLEVGGQKYKNLKSNIKTSINFVSNLWGKNPEYLDLNSDNHNDVTEIAFYYIQKGQKTEAEKVLDAIDVNTLTHNQRGFFYYYKGLLMKDVDCFAESIISFKLSGDTYYRKLPLLELEKLNYPKSIIKALLI